MQIDERVNLRLRNNSELHQPGGRNDAVAIDECNQTPDAMSTGYIDDVGILAWGKTTEQTCEILGKILEKAQRWASTHASVFAPNKFQLTHFTRSRKRINTETPIQTEWGKIRPGVDHGHETTMEAAHRRSQTQSNEDNQRAQLPRGIQLGRQPYGYATNICRHRAAASDVCMLDMVERKREGKAVHQENA
jgi:hypothetical protein